VVQPISGLRFGDLAPCTFKDANRPDGIAKWKQVSHAAPLPLERPRQHPPQIRKQSERALVSIERFDAFSTASR
jgi:hypothetical protein